MNDLFLKACVFSCLFCGYAALADDANTNSTLQPLPAPVQTTNIAPLTPGEQLGKDIFFDQTLSDPQGYSCATCHVLQTGFTGPSSLINVVTGPAPGVIPGRAGRRKPQPISYATYSPAGPYLVGAEGGTYVGGDFWDGRAPDTVAQAKMPFLDQNEMANTPIGPYPPHAGGYSPLVAQKLGSRPYAPLFREIFGPDVFQASSNAEIYELMAKAIAMYEASVEVNPFSSKFDASTNASPPANLYTLTPAEEIGRELFFGDAQCSQCHSSASLDAVSHVTQGKETFTMYCYANIGVPKNPANPYYAQTNCDSDPEGCNSEGTNFIDYGLGANPNAAPDGTVFFHATPGDIQQFRGLFKAPSLRNVDRRPYPGFVKSYMHNGVFKSLEEVVHFYNKRNIATNAAGDEVEFTLGYPPEGYTPIFPPPEDPDNVQNASGWSPFQAAHRPEPPDDDPDPAPIAYNGQVGNLQLTAEEEADLVSFLKTLTDGYTAPNPVIVSSSVTIASAPALSNTVNLQLFGKAGGSYVLQTSTDLLAWFPVSTNILADTSVGLTNTVLPGVKRQFWRVIQSP